MMLCFSAMKSRIVFSHRAVSIAILFAVLPFLPACTPVMTPPPEFSGLRNDLYESQIERLRAAYPDANLRAVYNEAGTNILVNDYPILFGPRASCPQASPDQPTDAPLCAMFAQTYPWGEGGRHPEPGFDPGRTRNEAFFKQMYGENEREVRKNLVPVDFLGTKVMFNKRHGAADALKRVTAKLERIMRDDPKLKAYILPTAGTFCWRKIKASPRLSFHSFGICIDLNVDKGIYWNWNPKPTAKNLADAQKNYPQIVVDAFESEGFIWGGKWSHFDYMHFEYRPELR